MTDPRKAKTSDMAAKLREEIRAKVEQNLTTPAPEPARFSAPSRCPSCSGSGQSHLGGTCGTCSGSGFIGTY